MKKSKVKKQNNSWFLIIGAVVAVLIIAILLFKISYPNFNLGAKTNEVAVLVNGEPIYVSDIEKTYNSLPAQLKEVYTKDYVLNQSIDEMLLLQEAKKKGIKVTSEEIENEINSLLKQNNLTKDELEARLKLQNLNLDDLKKIYEKQLKIGKLFNITVFANASTTAEEIRRYYYDNNDKFLNQEYAKVRHILILITDNATDAQAKEKINTINTLLRADNSNFCDLVTKYSEDTASIKNCGTYNVYRGQFVAEFEDASFKLKINQTEIIKTIYGYHLIQKLAFYPNQTKPLDEVYDEINQTIMLEKGRSNFNSYIQNLRDSAVIINYLQNPEKKTGNLDNFAKCITEKGAKLYGAYWCPHCSNQKTMFGYSVKYITYVECADPNNQETQTQECIDAGITGYPTWIINNEQYSGEQTLEKLSELTGCGLS